MNKLILGLSIALISATSAFADSSAIDVVNQQTVFNASAVDLEATGSIGTASQDEFRFGDVSPAAQASNANGPVAVTNYVTNDRLGGNS
jgi:hypothetical protein